METEEIEECLYYDLLHQFLELLCTIIYQLKSFKVASFLTRLEMVTVMISTITYNVHLIGETVVDLVSTDWNAQIVNAFRMLDSLKILSKMH